MDLRDFFRRRLKEAVRAKYGSLDRLYLLTGYSKGQLSLLIRGKRSPSIETVVKLARLLDVEVRDFFDFPEERELVATVAEVFARAKERDRNDALPAPSGTPRAGDESITRGPQSAGTVAEVATPYGPQRTTPGGLPLALTDHDILRRIVRGATDEELAKELGTDERAVRRLRRALLSVLEKEIHRLRQR